MSQAEAHRSGFDADQSAGDWDWQNRYWPEGRYADSAFLHLLYRGPYAKGGPMNLAEYTLGLGFAALAVAALAKVMFLGSVSL